MAQDSQYFLLKISDVIPTPYQRIFNQKFDTFNYMQSSLVSQSLQTDLNMVVAAPTGCGKTVVHELAITRLLAKSSNFKCLFLAPTKALCQQRIVEWSAKFSPFGLKVVEVTGDVDLRNSFRLIAQASIIISTPEKWDSITRSWRDHLFLFGAVDLLLVDEIHHLGEERGSTLETVIVRMRRVSELYVNRTSNHSSTGSERTELRIIALSATLPNLSDIGDWLCCRPEAVHYFDSSFRPIPLTVHTVAMGSAGNPFLFEKSLDLKVRGIIDRYGDKKQVLIFCSSKKSAEKLASLLCQQYGDSYRINYQRGNNAPISNLIGNILDEDLKRCVSKGIGYHHGGMIPDDRSIVEQLYLSGVIHILCSTSTLAHGVNLPAHLVIVKGTNSWRGGSRGYEKLNRSDIIQMIGRAGRPGFDTHGVAVIMTSLQEKEYYSDISLSADVVESTLLDVLVEAICAEVSQTVITSVDDCIAWVKSTFFYVRVKKNAAKYGFQNITDDKALEESLQQLSIKAVSDLSKEDIVNFDQATKTVSSRPETHIMARSMISFNTMVLLMKLPLDCTLSQFIAALSRAKELYKPVRRSEKKLLNDMMKAIRFPLKIRVQEPPHKAFVLLQAAVGRLDIKDFALRVEQSEIVESALRIMFALSELCKENCNGLLLLNAVLLDRSLRCRLWEVNYDTVFRQCIGVSDNTYRALISNHIQNASDLSGCSLQWITQRLSCTLAEGRLLMQFAQMMQSNRMVVRTVIDENNNSLRIEIISVSSNESGASAKEGVGDPSQKVPTYQLICFNVRTYKTLCYRKISHSPLQQGNNISFIVPLPKQEEKMSLHDISSHLICDFVGIDSVQSIDNPSSSTTAEASISLKLLSSTNEKNTSNNSTQNKLSKTARPENKTIEKVASNKASKASTVISRTLPEDHSFVNYSNTDSHSANHPYVSDVNEQVSDPQRSKLEDFWSPAQNNDYVKSTFLETDKDCEQDEDVSQHSSISFGKSLKQFEFSESNNPTMKESTFKSPKVVRNIPVKLEGKRSESASEPPPKKIKNSSPLKYCADTTPILNELALVRSKANELQLNNVPVKRLRNNYSHLTAASPRDVIQPVRNYSIGDDNQQLPPTNTCIPPPIMPYLPTQEKQDLQHSQDSDNSLSKHLVFKSSKRPLQQSFFESFIDDDDDSTIHDENKFRPAKSASQESSKSFQKVGATITNITNNKVSNHTFERLSSSNRETIPPNKTAVMTTMDYRTPSPTRAVQISRLVSQSQVNKHSLLPNNSSNSNYISYHTGTGKVYSQSAHVDTASISKPKPLKFEHDHEKMDNFDDIFF